MGDKDSLKNIKATGEFCWNLVGKPLLEAMNQTSAPLAFDENEFAFAGLDTAASHIVDVPRVKSSPVSMECKLTDIVQLKNAEGGLCESWFVMGEVVGVHIQKDMIEAGVYKTLKAEPVSPDLTFTQPTENQQGDPDFVGGQPSLTSGSSGSTMPALQLPRISRPVFLCLFSLQ